MSSTLFDDPARRSRTAYILQCLVEYLVSLFMTDAFLAKLLMSMGLDDATIGIISSVLSFTFLIQLFVIPVMGRIRSFKRIVVVFDTLGMVLYLFMYLLPFLPFSKPIMTVLSFVFLTGGSLAKYFSYSLYVRWVYTFVDPHRRGRFGSLNTSVSLIGSVALTLTAGRLFDSYEARGDLKGAFIIVSVYILISTVLNLVLLLLIKDTKNPSYETAHGHSSRVVRQLFSRRGYRLLLVCDCLESIAVYVTNGFLGTFKTADLMFSIWAIQIMAAAASCARIPFNLIFGRYSDRRSAVSGYLLGLWVMLLSFVCLVFTSPRTRWLMIVQVIVYNVSLCGVGINQTNMVYCYVPLEHFPQALALKQAMMGGLGFIASLIGSRILALVQSRGNLIFGVSIYGQQILGIVSCLFLIACILCTALGLKKQPLFDP